MASVPRNTRPGAALAVVWLGWAAWILGVTFFAYVSVCVHEVVRHHKWERGRAAETGVGGRQPPSFVTASCKLRRPRRPIPPLYVTGRTSIARESATLDGAAVRCDGGTLGLSLAWQLAELLDLLRRAVGSARKDIAADERPQLRSSSSGSHAREPPLHLSVASCRSTVEPKKQKFTAHTTQFK